MMTAANYERIMTLDDVAEYLHLSKSTIYRMANTGDIPVSKIGRRWRFRKSALDNWLADKESYNHAYE